MVILDTNVLSEMMKQSPDENLVQWLDHQQTNALYITSITVAEISYGLQALPSGKKRNRLQQAFDDTVEEAFLDRVLMFEKDAALLYGQLMAYRKKQGRPMSVCDGQIAAIATAKEFVVITRNIKDFKDCGVDLINPFEAVPVS